MPKKKKPEPRKIPLLPRRVDVCGRTYKVVRKKTYDEVTGEELCGSISFYRGEIYIPPRIDLEEAHQTLMHEIVHAVWHETGQRFDMSGGHAEKLTRAIEHGLWRAGYRLTKAGPS